MSVRAQAYTLESLIAAILLLTAVVFAMQSAVITPTSSGTLDQDVQGQLHQEAMDVLVTAENEGELSEQLRYWDTENETFADGEGDNDYGPINGYNDTVPVGNLGPVLESTFDEGIRYNVEIAYLNETDDSRDTDRLVFKGTPGDEVVVATYTVTLTEDMYVTGPDGEGQTLAEVDDPPIPNAGDGQVYNVVEVRIILW